MESGTGTESGVVVDGGLCGSVGGAGVFLINNKTTLRRNEVHKRLSNMFHHLYFFELHYVNLY